MHYYFINKHVLYVILIRRPPARAEGRTERLTRTTHPPSGGRSAASVASDTPASCRRGAPLKFGPSHTGMAVGERGSCSPLLMRRGARQWAVEQS